jgi:hypothetical protein
MDATPGAISRTNGFMERFKQIVGIGFIVIVVALTAAGLFGAFVWDPSHRPVVIVPGVTGAPWSVEVDGHVVCHGLPALTDEPHLKTCSITLPTGTHTFVVRSNDGAERFRTEATIVRGRSSYIWVPELPADLCVRTHEVKYSDGPQMPAWLTPPEKSAAVSAAFQDIGEVDVWFQEPPPVVKSNEHEDARLSVRLERCEPPSH